MIIIFCNNGRIWAVNERDSFIEQAGYTGVVNISHILLIEHLLRYNLLIAAHLKAITQASCRRLAPLTAVPSVTVGRAPRYLRIVVISTSATFFVARDAVELADGGLGARGPREPLIARLVQHEVAGLDNAQKADGCKKEEGYCGCKSNHSID